MTEEWAFSTSARIAEFPLRRSVANLVTGSVKPKSSQISANVALWVRLYLFVTFIQLPTVSLEQF